MRKWTNYVFITDFFSFSKLFVFTAVTAFIVVFCIFYFKDRNIETGYAKVVNFESIDVRTLAESIGAKSSLDKSATEFAAITKHLTHGVDCLPIKIGKRGPADVFYQYCSEAAIVARSKEMSVTSEFSVPASLARRFNFWRDVYSLWTSEHYILHPADYPEVALEILDSSPIVYDKGSEKGEILKERTIEKISHTQKREYKKLLLALHASRSKPLNSLPPALRRVANSMRHIKDQRKYFNAAMSLRVQRGQKDYIANGIPSASSYMSHIETEFSDAGLPTELAYLSFVESSFNLKARSKVGASGVFQLMKATAAQYLKVQAEIDERNDPVKAARAAAKLLRFNYKLTGSWPLAITAYNHGVGGITKGVELTGSRDVATLIKYYRDKQFGFASQNFYSSFLAILATIKNWNEIFPDIKIYQPIEFQTVRLSCATTVSKIRKKYLVPRRNLSQLNPDLSRSFVYHNGRLPQGYEIKIPLKSK